MLRLKTSVHPKGDLVFPLKLPKTEPLPALHGVPSGRGIMCTVASLNFDAVPYDVEVTVDTAIEGKNFVEIKIPVARGATMATAMRAVAAGLSAKAVSEAELFPSFVTIDESREMAMSDQPQTGEEEEEEEEEDEEEAKAQEKERKRKAEEAAAAASTTAAGNKKPRAGAAGRNRGQKKTGAKGGVSRQQQQGRRRQQQQQQQQQGEQQPQEEEVDGEGEEIDDGDQPQQQEEEEEERQQAPPVEEEEDEQQQQKKKGGGGGGGGGGRRTRFAVVVPPDCALLSKDGILFSLLSLPSNSGGDFDPLTANVQVREGNFNGLLRGFTNRDDVEETLTSGSVDLSKTVAATAREKNLAPVKEIVLIVVREGIEGTRSMLLPQVGMNKKAHVDPAALAKSLNAIFFDPVARSMPLPIVAISRTLGGTPTTRSRSRWWIKCSYKGKIVSFEKGIGKFSVNVNLNEEIARRLKGWDSTSGISLTSANPKQDFEFENTNYKNPFSKIDDDFFMMTSSSHGAIEKTAVEGCQNINVLADLRKSLSISRREPFIATEGFNSLHISFMDPQLNPLEIEESYVAKLNLRYNTLR